MSLQAAIDRVLPELRSQATARMKSTATVYRITGRTAQNETTGEEVPEWEAVLTGSPLRLVSSRAGGSSHTVTVGGVEFEEATARADFPAGTDELADNDYIDVTAGEWAGSAYRIVETVKGDQMTARRVPVVEVARPAEWDA